MSTSSILASTFVTHLTVHRCHGLLKRHPQREACAKKPLSIFLPYAVILGSNGVILWRTPLASAPTQNPVFEPENATVRVPLDTIYGLQVQLWLHRVNRVTLVASRCNEDNFAINGHHTANGHRTSSSEKATKESKTARRFERLKNGKAATDSASNHSSESDTQRASESGATTIQRPNNKLLASRENENVAWWDDEAQQWPVGPGGGIPRGDLFLGAVTLTKKELSQRGGSASRPFHLCLPLQKRVHEFDNFVRQQHFAKRLGTADVSWYADVWHGSDEENVGKSPFRDSTSRSSGCERRNSSAGGGSPARFLSGRYDASSTPASSFNATVVVHFRSAVGANAFDFPISANDALAVASHEVQRRFLIVRAFQRYYYRGTLLSMERSLIQNRVVFPSGASPVPLLVREVRGSLTSLIFSFRNESGLAVPLAVSGAMRIQQCLDELYGILAQEEATRCIVERLKRNQVQLFWRGTQLSEKLTVHFYGLPPRACLVVAARPLRPSKPSAVEGSLAREKRHFTRPLRRPLQPAPPSGRKQSPFFVRHRQGTGTPASCSRSQGSLCERNSSRCRSFHRCVRQRRKHKKIGKSEACECENFPKAAPVAVPKNPCDGPLTTEQSIGLCSGLHSGKETAAKSVDAVSRETVREKHRKATVRSANDAQQAPHENEVSVDGKRCDSTAVEKEQGTTKESEKRLQDASASAELQVVQSRYLDAMKRVEELEATVARLRLQRRRRALSRRPLKRQSSCSSLRSFLSGE